jgi:hypothetical protein
MQLIASGAAGNVQRCTGCHGIACDDLALSNLQRHWFHWSQSDMRSIDTGSAAEGRLWNALRDVSCPQCSRGMRRVSVPEQTHLELDRCVDCSLTFFDAGEMTDYRYRTFAGWARDWLHAPGNVAR